LVIQPQQQALIIAIMVILSKRINFDVILLLGFLGEVDSKLNLAILSNILIGKIELFLITNQIEHST